MKIKLKQAKKAQMPAFGWVFAIIIGIVILFLAAYFIGNMISSKEYETEAELSRSFEILLNPFSSIGGVGPISMGKTVKMPQESIIQFDCNEYELGYQSIRIRTKGSFGKWNDFTEDNHIYDKYIFSENLRGNNFYILSKSFELPFRIDDLIYIISDNYCFINAPEKMISQFGNMNIPKIKFDANCSGDEKLVCFEGDYGNCDTIVMPESEICDDEFFCDNFYDYGTVIKDGESRKFVTDALLYAAIFSDEENYVCNYNRLMYRLDVLCDIYEEKISMMDSKCNSNSLNSHLDEFKSSIGDDIDAMYISAEKLNDKNSDLDCSVF